MFQFNTSLYSLIALYLVFQVIQIDISTIEDIMVGVAALSVTNICTGGQFACALLDNNKIKCWGLSVEWGYDNFRYMGDSLDEIGDNLPYIDVSSSLTPQQLFCGYDQVCIIFTSGDMKCMGRNSYGKLGLGLSNDVIGHISGHEGDLLPVVDIGTGLKVLDASLSDTFTCIVATGGYVKCFGNGSYGKLGYGNTNSIGTSSSQMGDALPFVDLGTNVTVSSIHTPLNGWHACVILSTPSTVSRKIKCWGRNAVYQLGYGDTKNRGDNSGEMGDNLTVIDLGTESRVTKLSLGNLHTCALLIDEVSLKCWGNGGNGRLASGSTNSITSTGNSIPVVSIDSGYKIKYFSGSATFSCIVYDDYLTLKCFGYNSYGELGQEDTVDRGGSSTTTISYISPVQLGTGSLKISSVHSGANFNCVLFSDSSLKCFGRNFNGQCATGTGYDIGDSGDEMGANLQYAQLFASAPTSPTTNTPTKNPTIQQYAIQTIISFSAGAQHACAVFIDGRMKCWGLSTSLGMAYKLIGDSLNEVGEYLSYINVGTNQTISKVSCGGNHVCVVLSSGYTKCMGSNLYGQIGLGLTSFTIGETNAYVGDKLPTINLGLSIFAVDVATGVSHTCALVTGNKIKCYGRNNNGQLGQGNTNDIGTSLSHMGSNLPYTDLGTDVEVDSIHSSALSDHNCVILSAPSSSSQRFKCWGSGGVYQLGYGDNNSKGDNSGEMGDNLPLVDLGTESKVSQLSLGASFTCALLITNVMKCFGYGAYGQLASGSNVDITSIGDLMPFVPIDSGKTIKYVGTGSGHTCIVYDNEVTMKCTGANTYGQLGQGDTNQRGDSPPTTFPNISAIDLGTGSLKIKSVHGGDGFTCVLFTDSSIKCFGYNEDGECLIGRAGRIGDSSNEMGGNLQFAMLFSPSQSPTNSPTKMPTPSPTSSPTKPPSEPTKNPTNLPSLSPTKSPTLPTKSPTSPTSPSFFPSQSPTSTPTKKPTNVPSTAAPISTSAATNNNEISIGLGIVIPLSMVAAGIFVYKCRSKMKMLNNSKWKGGSTGVSGSTELAVTNYSVAR